MAMNVTLSIIIVNWNTEALLRDCLRSLSDLKIKTYEIIVVDNASTDGSAKMVRQEFPWVKLIVNKKNLGFANACNQGIAESRGDYLLLLNPDTIVPSGTIEKALEVFSNAPSVGILGCGFCDKSGKIVRSVYPFPTPIWDLLCVIGAADLARTRQARLPNGIFLVKGFLTGAFLLVKRQAIEEVGPLDSNIFMYGEDVEWCYRFYKAGWAVGYYPEVTITHIGNQSGEKAFGKKRLELVYRGIMYFQQKYFPTYWRLGPFIRAFGFIAKMTVLFPLIWLSPGRRKMREYWDAFIANYRAMFHAWRMK